MDTRRLYNELKNYRKMKNRDIEISIEMERDDNKYKKGTKRINNGENYNYSRNYNYKDSLRQKDKSNDVINFNK